MFILIIFVDLAGKLYNHYTLKAEIETKMSREVTKGAGSHDQWMEMQVHQYKKINVRNGQLVVFTSTLMVDVALSIIILVLYCS